MKKFYSILAFAAFMFSAAEVNAQTAEVDGNVIKFSGNWTADAINAKLAEDVNEQFGTVYVNDVVGLAHNKIVPTNPNAIIVATADQVSNTINTINPKVTITSHGQSGIYIVNNFVVTDGHEFTCTLRFDALRAEYHRTVKNYYNTMCLPFCFRIEDIADRYHLEYLDRVENNTLYFKRITGADNPHPDQYGSNHISDMTPLIIHDHEMTTSPNDIDIVVEHGVSVNQNENPRTYPMNDKMNLVGTLTNTKISASEPNVLYIQDNLFWKYEDFNVDVTVPAFRCVIKATGNDILPAGTKKFSIAVEDDITGVTTIVNSLDDAPSYNLNGIRVSDNTKGLVIKNGKIIFNK